MINTQMSVEQIIKKSVEDAKLLKSKERRKEVRKLLDFYSGTEIEKYIQNYFQADQFREVPPYNANITRRFINKLSQIYTVGAKRKVNSLYDELTIKKDAKMKHVERMTRLVGTIATQIIYKENYGKPCFDYRPIYYFDVHLKDAYTPSAIMYPLLMQPEDISHTEQCEWAYWDESIYVHYDENGNILEEYEHGYGVLPFVFTHREEQIDEFLVEGASDICGANLQTNITLTELQLGLRFQMFGQAYTSGVYTDAPMQRMGSDRILNLPEGGNFDIITPGGDPQKVIEALKFQIELVAQNNHLYVQFAQDGGETPSGIALRIKDLDRFEDYQDDLDLWRSYEHDFYKVEKEIADFNGISLPEKFGIDFNEVEYPKTVQDQLAWNDWMLANNMITPAELYVKYNKDFSLKEAEKKIEENKQKNGTEEQETTTQSLFAQARERAQGNQ